MFEQHRVRGRWLARAVLIGALMQGCVAASAAEGDLVLTNATQIRALTREKAAQSLPVSLRGVVLLGQNQDTSTALTILDETAGIYLELQTGILTNYHRGQLVEVEGTTDPGKFAPMVKASAVRVVGEGRIPDPHPVTWDELLSGSLDAQWVEVSGVVHSSPGHYAPEDSSSREVLLSTGGGELLLIMSDGNGKSLQVDSEVRVRGVCFYQFNKARQALNPVLRVQSPQDILVKVAAPDDPYAAPVRSLESLMQFNLEGASGHRVRVQGVVLRSDPGEAFWIRQDKQGLRVLSRQSTPLEIGTIVDALGFPRRGDYGPVLIDAVYRKIRLGAAPVPVRLDNAAQALDHDGDLVELEAVIEEQKLAMEGCRLSMAEGTDRFAALLRLRNGQSAPSHWCPGSRVRVAGISSVTASSGQGITGTIEPQEFRLLLRSVGDLLVLTPPSWWTSQHLAWVLGVGVGALLLVVAGVVWNARRRVREEVIARGKSEAEFAAVWNERNRMARELHDTLAQGLGAILMQLEVAKDELPAETQARSSLEKAQSLARANLTDARKSIWNMRSQVLETGDLASALSAVLHSLTDGTETKASLRVVGSPRRFAPVTENELLRLGQEAITNAVRHARAKRIELLLEFSGRDLRMAVSDDGQGFDPAHPPVGEGGFGLVAIRERISRLGGELNVGSEQGKGTLVAMQFSGLV